MKLSVTLATYNEEGNIGECLKSVTELADEIVVVDGQSSDATVEIVRSFGAQVTSAKNQSNFHINKQKANDLATGEWILQLDADERISKDLAQEIKQVMGMTDAQLEVYQQQLSDGKLFLRHQRLLEERDGTIGTSEGEYVAFFIPRLNYFLGKYLRYGGVYPDGVIRLFKKGQAYLPCKDVHEQYVVKGRVGWLKNPLYHYDSPDFNRYIQRNNRYINLLASQLAQKKVGKNPVQLINYIIIKPLWWFLLTQIRHKGILDGYQGLIFSLFSALRFPRAYIKYLLNPKSFS